MLDKVILAIIALLVILTIYLGLHNNFQNINASIVLDANWLNAKLIPESPFPLQAKAGIVINRESGQILYQRNADMQLPIASLTKLMTALVAQYQEDLFYKMLVWSDNKAAEDLVLDISKLNQKAQELGMLNTHFIDASGLDPGSISTPNDLVILAEEISKRPDLIKILQTPEYNQIKNTNQLLGLPGVVAGKTGLTDEAGQCLLLITDKYISIVLNAEDRFEQSEKLIKIIDDKK
ncbi:MAG: hypothetical protein ABIG90_01345 [bacterium]